MLLEIQGRLGTPTEEPDDLEKARAIAHRLSNALSAIRRKTEQASLQHPSNRSDLMSCHEPGGQMFSDCGR